MNRDQDTRRADEDEQFELPLPEEDDEHRIRRRLFGGYRPDDVQDAISSRDETIALLRRDMAALWLAFGQHERTIKQMLEALEALGAERIDPPGGRADEPAPAGTPGDRVAGPEAASAGARASGAPTAGVDAAGAGALGAQLAGLDEVLAAIEHATQSLEQAYAEEVAGGAAGSEPAAEAGAEEDEEEEEQVAGPDRPAEEAD